MLCISYVCYVYLWGCLKALVAVRLRDCSYIQIVNFSYSNCELSYLNHKLLYSNHKSKIGKKCFSILKL